MAVHHFFFTLYALSQKQGENNAPLFFFFFSIKLSCPALHFIDHSIRVGIPQANGTLLDYYPVVITKSF
jgi:hypothetical protein